MKQIRQMTQGTIFTVVGNCNGHNYTVGEKYKVVQHSLREHNVTGCSLDGYFVGNTLKDSDITAFTTRETMLSDIENISSTIKELEEMLQETKTKLKYLEASGEEEFNENEFRVFIALKTIEDKSISEKERIKIIAGLLN